MEILGSLRLVVVSLEGLALVRVFVFDNNKSGAYNRQVCGKCKDTRHSTRDCMLGQYIICGKESHITDDCTWLKQMKVVPKYVGYAAKGLGVLLVQNSKDVFATEHVNPMTIVRIKSGSLNETQSLRPLVRSSAGIGNGELRVMEQIAI